jgi:hypothetical protein
MNRLLNDSFKPSRLFCELRYIPPDGGDPIIRDPKPAPGKGGGKAAASNISLLTSTGGLFGTAFVLITPFLNVQSGNYGFLITDPTDFNCEEDCVYNFRQEDKPGRVIDVHKVYLQYRDLGKVSFLATMTATQYNRDTNKETIDTDSKLVTVGNTKPDKKIHSYFVDLKVQGERPQLSITRKAGKGPLSIVTAMMIGNANEENQL